MIPPVLAWMREQREALVDLVERLAVVESPSTEPSAQPAAFGVLAAELVRSGMRPRWIPGGTSGGCLLATPAEQPCTAPRQLLLGHIDTVWPVGTMVTMPLERSDGVLTGPGVYDMKAGLAMIVFALRALRALPLPLTVSPVVLVNSDEEIGSADSSRWIRRLAGLVERVFVLEPSLGPRGRLKTARKGVGRFEVTVHGRAAHAGLDPEAGVSAILELSHQVQALFALNDPDRGVTVNVGTIEGGLRPNVVAPVSHAVVDVRVPTAVDAQRVEAAIHALRPATEGVRLEVEGRFGRPPMERTPGGAALWRRARALGEELGLRLEEATAGGGSDGNTTSQTTPTLDGLGAVGAGAHAPDERIFVHRVVERAALLALLLAEPPSPEVASWAA